MSDERDERREKVRGEIDEILRADLAELYPETGVLTGWLVIAIADMGAGTCALTRIWDDGTGPWVRAGMLREATLASDRELMEGYDLEEAEDE